MLEVGFTPACIRQLCLELNVPIHIKWGGTKIESFTPSKAAYEQIAIRIWGDHCYVVGDPAVTRIISRESVSTPTIPSSEIVATIGHRISSIPPSQYWSTFSKIAPGHFKCDDVIQIRAELLSEGICPQVKLSGTGIVKGLRYNDCHIHNWPTKTAHVCLKFLEELSKVKTHSLQYRGESLAVFGQQIFDE